MKKRAFVKKDGRLLWLYGEHEHKLTPLPEGEGAPPAAPHLRWHPLRGEWAIYAAHKQERTFLPPKDHCPSKPGGYPTEIPFTDFEIVVFQNRFPSLHLDAPAPPKLAIPTARGQGFCEVAVCSPKYKRSLATLTQARRDLLEQVWTDRYKELYSHDFIQFVMSFENRGEEVGVTPHHPHGQIYAYPFIPPVIAKEAGAFRESSVICSLIPKLDNYVVVQTETMIAFVPPFARFPYEVWIAPKRHHPGPWKFSDAGIRDFAQILGDVVDRYDRLFNRPLPYAMAMHAAPKGEEETFHFHVEFYPRMRAAGNLKYLAGTEVGAGTFAADLLPEDTAKHLREVK